MEDERGHASVHVLAAQLRRPWRAASAAATTTRALRDDPAVTFFLCGRSSAGSGRRDVSRSLSPNRLVVIIEWRSHEEAVRGRLGVDGRAREAGDSVWSAALVPSRARGTWDGHAPFRPGGVPTADGKPVASLTCARVRPRRMVDFYVRAFPALARQARSRDSRMVAGLGFGGAIPLRDACTISFWPSAQDIEGYAYGKSAHDVVQRRSAQERWMSQSLFARFVVTDHAGAWAGGDPLAAP